MADRDPIQPLHQPVLPVFEEEEVWVAAGRGAVRGRGGRGPPRVGARALPSPARDQRGRRRGRDGAGRHGVAAEPRGARLHARYGTAPRRDLRPVRTGARALRDRRGVRVPGDGGGLGDGDRSRPEPDVRERRPASAVLRDPQGGAAEAQARDARRVGRGAPPGAVAEPAEHREGGAGPGPRRDREAEPGGRLDARPDLGVRARARRPVPRALRPGVHVDRLRAVHPGRRARRVGARGPMVVGAGDGQGVRDPLLGGSAGIRVGPRASGQRAAGGSIARGRR